MRAKCVSAAPTPSQQLALGRHYVPGRTEYPVMIGRVYTVLGVGFWDGIVWYEIAPSARTLVSIPAFLFETTNGRPSCHWHARSHDDGAFTLWPESFYHPYYHEHLSEGVAAATADFKHLLELLEGEAARP